jgi:uncharacterized protein (TIGR02147 family)
VHQKPDIFVYDDYRRYLADWMAWKSTTGSYSKRWFSRQAGFAAPNLLQLVIDGRRNLSLDSIGRFARCLALSARESHYFESMVLMNQAKTLGDRHAYFAQMARNPGRRKAVPWEEPQLRLFKHWLGPVLFELIGCEDFSPSSDWILSKLDNKVGVKEIQSTLRDLLASGWVTERPDGTLVRNSSFLDSGDNVNGLLFHSYHEQALAKAVDALDEIPASQRHFFVITSGAPPGLLPRLKELGEKFENELLALLDEYPDGHENVYQVSVQMFPVVGAKPKQPGRGKKA